MCQILIDNANLPSNKSHTINTHVHQAQYSRGCSLPQSSNNEVLKVCKTFPGLRVQTFEKLYEVPKSSM